jgi:translation initiation factor 1
MTAGKRIPTDGGAGLGQNPFARLEAANPADTGYRKPESGEQKSEIGSRRSEQPAGEKKSNACPSIRSPVSEIRNPKNRGRVDITRQTAGRGGKTVTVVSGFLGIGQPEKEQLAKKMQKACGAGGTVKDGCIEIQGDKREPVAKILAEAGFRPVLAGG